MSKNKDLRRFADSFLERTDNFGPPLRVLSDKDWRLELLKVESPFQVERVILEPDITVKTHRHPHVDSFEIYLAGSGTISIGRRSYAVDRQLSSRLRMLPVPRMIWHGGDGF